MSVVTLPADDPNRVPGVVGIDGRQHLHALSALPNTRHGGQPTLDGLFTPAFQPVRVLDRHERRDELVVTFDDDALTRGGAVQRLPEPGAELTSRDGPDG